MERTECLLHAELMHSHANKNNALVISCLSNCLPTSLTSSSLGVSARLVLAYNPHLGRQDGMIIKHILIASRGVLHEL